MKKIIPLFALMLLAPAVHAGSAGAGPGGNGAVTIGTLASSITLDRALGGVALDPSEKEVADTLSETLTPGSAGQTPVDAAALDAIFELVQNATGSRTSADGQVASVPVTLSGGGAGVIIINRATGVATLIKRS